MTDDKTRALLIAIRRLLLQAVDLIERECLLGKYAPAQPVPISPVDSIAGVLEPVQPSASKGV